MKKISHLMALICMINICGAYTVFYDEVESPNTGWKTTGLWHMDAKNPYSQNQSWAYNTGEPGYDYDIGKNEGTLTTEELDLSGCEQTTLRYMSWIDNECYLYAGCAFDKGYLEVSTDGGISFQQVEDAFFYREKKIWHNEETDLSAYDGEKITLRFRFDTQDSMYNQYEGWYIDDVEITCQDMGNTASFVQVPEYSGNTWMIAAFAAIGPVCIAMWKIRLK